MTIQAFDIFLKLLKILFGLFGQFAERQAFTLYGR